MINVGEFLESPAMRSSEAATGTRTTTQASSISTTIRPTTATTTSGSADPKITCLDDEHSARGRSILGRNSPGGSPKARRQAKPRTAPGPTGAGVERGRDTEFTRLTSLPNLFA